MGRLRLAHLVTAVAGVGLAVSSVSSAQAAAALPSFEVVKSLETWGGYFDPTQERLMDFSASSIAVGPLAADETTYFPPGEGIPVLGATIGANPTGLTGVSQTAGDKFLSVRLCGGSSTADVCAGGTRSLLFTFPQPINGFLADWGSTTTAGSLKFAASGGANVIGLVSFAIELPGGTGILGVVASSPFDTVIFGLDDITSVEAFNVDDIRTAVVPLPATLPLFASALAGITLAGWRRSKRGKAFP